MAAVASTDNADDDDREDPSSAPAFLDVAAETSPSQVSPLSLAVLPLEWEDAASKSLCDELG